jgi:phosphoribosylaminoimidazole-succinocarboxamide synthase
MMEPKNEVDIVREIERRTLGYVDRIKVCYEAHQQITGDKVVTILQSSSMDKNDDEGTSQIASIQCLRGKVRDRFIPTNISIDRVALLTTDRQSGFDRQLAIVPYKGAVLNLCSQYWFEQTQDIIPNHIIQNIHHQQQQTHPNVAIVQKCIPFPIEFVVRYVFP